MLSSPQQVARFSVRMGYPRDDVERTIRELFPDADAPAVVEEAIQSALLREGEDEAAVEREERKAVEAEHDLGESMHG